VRQLLLAAAVLAACSAPGQPVAGPSLAPSPTTTPAAATPTPTPSPAAAPSPTLLVGGDISWPNCPIGTPGALPKKQAKGNPLPGPGARFVVIGLTNGPGFYPNPCLAWEVSEAKRLGLATAAYAFTTMPNPAQVTAYGKTGPYSTRTALGRLQNASYQEAQINIRSLRRSGLRTPIVWVDIEPQPYLEPWESDVVANRAVIRASLKAYDDAGIATGLYSSDNPWRSITGGLRDDRPTWVTVGPRGQAAALAKCAAPSFSGGRPVLAQWWDDDVQDKDLVCPGAEPGQLFAPAP
jgi:hypothetical protein